ncbi:hypothetical protein MRX96_030509 [Rhipicephalus microplus]
MRTTKTSVIDFGLLATHQLDDIELRTLRNSSTSLIVDDVVLTSQAKGTHGDSVVEYCFENDKASAPDAIRRCAQQSSAIVDTYKVLDKKEQIFSLLFALPFMTKEYWVDLKAEDISKLRGVISVDFTQIDWSATCATVWIGGIVPWFFVRNCSDLYRVLCESTDSAESPTESILGCTIRERRKKVGTRLSRTLRPVCVRNVASNYQESIEECGKLGMELILLGLEWPEYIKIVKYYFLRYMVPRPRSALWDRHTAQNEEQQLPDNV